MRLFTFLMLAILPLIIYGQDRKLPEGFVHITDVIPDVILDIRYAGKNNFIGEPVRGYIRPTAILSVPAAEALAGVQKELEAEGYGIKVFDAYRPQKAVDHFVEWAQKKDDTLQKRNFYPEIPKKELFSRGYISSRSGHSRGSTVDLSLVDLQSGKQVDMGGDYDFFGERSHHDTGNITAEQKKNRELLKSKMQKFGFVPYQQEWWHYTFQPEPYPDTFFDFEVK